MAGLQELLDEIALEGLEGTTLENLWNLIEIRQRLALINDDIKEKLWQYLKLFPKKLSFYELKEERVTIQYYDRFKNVDEDYGIPVAPLLCPFQRFDYAPIDKNNERGSCQDYDERKPVPFEELSDLQYKEVKTKWGNRLVVVACLELREKAIISPNAANPEDLLDVHYCFLEFIGRSRYNGETTSGPWSVLQFYKQDPRFIFHIKKILLKSNLILEKTITELRGDRVLVTTILVLPRFFSEQPNLLGSVMEVSYDILKNAPDNRMKVFDVHQHFPFIKRLKSFKKIIATSLYRKAFDVKTTDRSTEGKSKKSDRQESKNPFAIITLRNPNKTISDIFSEELKRNNVKLEEDSELIDFEKENENSDEDEDNDVFDDDDSYVDMPIREQLLKIIEEAGERGIEPTVLASKVGIHKVTLRAILKYWTKIRLVHFYKTSHGRQHLQMLVAAKYGKSVKSQNARIEDCQDFKCAPEPNIPVIPPDEVLEDIPTITHEIKPLIFPVKEVKIQKTERLNQRKRTIVDEINKNCIVIYHQMRNIITASEKERGYKDKICTKSLKRVVNGLVMEKAFNLYEVTLRSTVNAKEGSFKVYRYLTHPKIGADHEILRHEILKVKHVMYLNIEDRRLREKNRLTKAAIGSGGASVLAKNRKKAARNITEKAAKAVVKKAVKFQEKSKITSKAKPPKFLISRYMHEFLYYIVVELNEYQQAEDLDSELLEDWRKMDSTIEVNQCMADIEKDISALETSTASTWKMTASGPTKMFGHSIKAYTRPLNWRTFIPPLQTYADKPAGWVHLIDAVNRMPLSLFNKIFRFDIQRDPKIAEYLNHPIRQHYLLHQLPDEITETINRIELQKVYITMLKLLNNMGLIQINYQKNIKDQFLMWIYLNRQTAILDTTITERAYQQINPNLNYSVVNFELNSFADLHQYWTELQRICIFTKLGFFKDNDKNLLKDRIQGKIKELSFIPSVGFDDAPKFDTGARPGDGLGAAGLSSILFAHAFRNWSWPLRSRSRVSDSIKSSKVTNQSKKLGGVNNKPSSEERSKTKKSQNKMSAHEKRLAHCAPRDDFDRAALKNMRTIRATWTEEEDNILKATRAVYNYIAAPVSTLQLLTLGKIGRDAIYERVGIANKTSRSCLRRIQFLMKLNRHLPSVPQWLYALQRNKKINEKYGSNFLKNLEKVYPEKKEFEDALVKHFLIILAALLNIINNEEIRLPENCTRFLPQTIEEFHAKFVIRSQTKPSLIYNLNPRSDKDLQIATVYNVLHSSLCSTQDKTVYTLQAFEIYKKFPEEILDEAYTKARCDHLVIKIKRKHIENTPGSNNLTGPGFFLSSKYRLRLQFLKIPYEIFGLYFEYMNKVLPKFFSRTTETDPVLELRSPQSGYIYFLSDTILRVMWNCNVVMPKKILLIDRSQISGISSAERILKKFQTIFKNAPEAEYSKELESDDVVEGRIKVRSPDVKHKIFYNPYDVISKLPVRQLHFFCALNHFDKEVHLRPDQLFQSDKEHDTVIIKCPFNCILRKGCHFEAIQRVISEKKTKINHLKAANENEQVELTTKSGIKLKINSSNLLSVSRSLESFWRKKEEKIDKKDFGKLPENMKPNYLVDWIGVCQEMLQNSSSKNAERIKCDDDDSEDDDDDLDDDYESLLGKSSLRAQDAIVVNLPTLQFRLRDNVKESLECVPYNNVEAPKVLIEGHLKANELLKKIQSDALWKHMNEPMEPLLSNSKLTSAERNKFKKIHDYIRSQTFGASPMDLLERFPNEDLLRKALQFLMDHYIVKRVGVESFLYVHKDHINNWIVQTFHITRLEREALRKTKDSNDGNALKRKSVSSHEVASTSRAKRRKPDEKESENQNTILEQEEQIASGSKNTEVQPIEPTEVKTDRHCLLMRPRPWIRLNASINRRALDRWLGTILSECMASSGCTVTSLCERFPILYGADLQFLLELLIDLDCIHLMQIEIPKVHNFLDKSPAPLKEREVYDIYDPENTYIVAHVGAVSRMATFIGSKKYATEFI